MVRSLLRGTSGGRREHFPAKYRPARGLPMMACNDEPTGSDVSAGFRSLLQHAHRGGLDERGGGYGGLLSFLASAISALTESLTEEGSQTSLQPL